MRKFYVDIFYCKRKNIKKAIQSYLQEIQDLDGIVCPSVIFLNSESMNPKFNHNYKHRIFSIQRGHVIGANKEVKVVINLIIGA